MKHLMQAGMMVVALFVVGSVGFAASDVNAEADSVCKQIEKRQDGECGCGKKVAGVCVNIIGKSDPFCKEVKKIKDEANGKICDWCTANASNATTCAEVLAK